MVVLTEQIEIPASYEKMGFYPNWNSRHKL